MITWAVTCSACVWRQHTISLRVKSQYSNIVEHTDDNIGCVYRSTVLCSRTASLITKTHMCYSAEEQDTASPRGLQLKLVYFVCKCKQTSFNILLYNSLLGNFQQYTDSVSLWNLFSGWNWLFYYYLLYYWLSQHCRHLAINVLCFVFDHVVIVFTVSSQSSRARRTCSTSTPRPSARGSLPPPRLSMSPSSMTPRGVSTASSASREPRYACQPRLQSQYILV